VDLILDTRFNAETAEDEYLCKLKGISYLHLEWLQEYALNSDELNGKQKLKKFKKTFERISDSPFDEN